VTGGKPIAVLLQSISGVSAINPLGAFYDIHGGKREVLFFYFVPDTTRDFFLYYNIRNVQNYVHLLNINIVFRLVRLGCEHGYKYYEYLDMKKKIIGETFIGEKWFGHTLRSP
jgi:hypothetical protein